jgi:hypothetical protein
MAYIRGGLAIWAMRLWSFKYYDTFDCMSVSLSLRGRHGLDCTFLYGSVIYMYIYNQCLLILEL